MCQFSPPSHEHAGRATILGAALFPLALVWLQSEVAVAELRVPAFTAYVEPIEGGTRVSSRRGVVGWQDPAQHVLWFGQLKQAGVLECRVELRLPEGEKSRLRLSLAGQSREVELVGNGDRGTVAGFGPFEVQQPGYCRFDLESLNAAGQPAGDVQALLLSGQAAEGAHFNLRERRNAASVHLFYPLPPDTHVAAFACEVTAVEDPTSTFYMACGWQRGYFGMQVNSPVERRIIFSVWDSGNEAVDRAKVAAEKRVTLVAKGDGVYAGDFGNEGTGGHSHLKYLWKTGEPQRFLATARPVDGTFTVYSGYYFHPEEKQWMLISSWKAPQDGGWLKRLHSFSENFGGENGHLRRKALFGSQWIRTDRGDWIELTEAMFSHDPTGRSDRLDRFMGVEGSRFFLSHGGFVAGHTEYGERFERPSANGPPPDTAGLPFP